MNGGGGLPGRKGEPGSPVRSGTQVWTLQSSGTGMKGEVLYPRALAGTHYGTAGGALHLSAPCGVSLWDPFTG